MALWRVELAVMVMTRTVAALIHTIEAQIGECGSLVPRQVYDS
jgi:hypothetical protein